MYVLLLSVLFSIRKLTRIQDNFTISPTPSQAIQTQQNSWCGRKFKSSYCFNQWKYTRCTCVADHYGYHIARYVRFHSSYIYIYLHIVICSPDPAINMLVFSMPPSPSAHRDDIHTQFHRPIRPNIQHREEHRRQRIYQRQQSPSPTAPPATSLSTTTPSTADQGERPPHMTSYMPLATSVESAPSTPTATMQSARSIAQQAQRACDAASSSPAQVGTRPMENSSPIPIPRSARSIAQQERRARERHEQVALSSSPTARGRRSETTVSFPCCYIGSKFLTFCFQ
jgi:hypothetical protein